MMTVEEARANYKKAGRDLDAYSVLNIGKDGMEEAKEKYRKAVKDLLMVDENFKKMYYGED